MVACVHMIVRVHLLEYSSGPPVAKTNLSTPRAAGLCSKKHSRSRPEHTTEGIEGTHRVNHASPPSKALGDEHSKRICV